MEIPCVKPGHRPNEMETARKPTNHKLGIRVDGNERPRIASIPAVLKMLRFCVLRLGSHIRPNLIDLDAVSGNGQRTEIKSTKEFYALSARQGMPIKACVTLADGVEFCWTGRFSPPRFVSAKAPN